MPDHERAERLAREFDLEHTKEEPAVLDNHEYLFSTGATRDENKLGLMMLPSKEHPEGEYRLAYNVRRYWRVRVEQAKRKLSSLNERYSFTVPPDEDAALKELQALKNEEAACQQKVIEAEDALNETRFGKRALERRDEVAAQKERFEAWQSKRKDLMSS